MNEGLDKIIGCIYRRDVSGIDRLIRYGWDVNERDGDGRTALMHACLSGGADIDVMASLIQYGADVNIADAGQAWTVLHFAARDQNVEAVKLLLHAGARANAADAFGNTPLWRTVMHNAPNLEIIELLVKNGSNPNLENRHGVSPRDIAEKMGNSEVVNLLAGNGRDARDSLNDRRS